RLVVLIVETQSQQCVGSEVGLKNAIEHRCFAPVTIQMRMFVLISHHASTPQATAFVQRATYVDFAPIVIPAAYASRDVAAEVAGGLLAAQADGGARRAAACQQAGGALEHLDAVIDSRVAQGVARRVGRVACHGYAVILEVLDGEPPRVVFGALAIIGTDADA